MDKIKLDKKEYELLKKTLEFFSNENDKYIVKGLFEEEKDYMEVPFDFDKAKNGLPVRTKCGCDVRIVCWDKLGEYPIVGLVKRSEELENVVLFDKFGIPMAPFAEIDSLICVVKKRKIWVSVYLNENGYIQAAVPSDVDSRYKVLATIEMDYFPK